ncbi:aminoglycoside phosphotransferase family protein [Amycolatopsis acidicola]|uniref:Aminoglycoside phosphotransferase family protein n=1 Tax=Amycolatopsis acidicola TaxID=2596893 RepID=A0A5N0VJR2_9PSEU|nr:aminoglycoside phosphotransferase family protein [Amycolatopsis acidicola]KAA9164972.1 aminoglycoside phosphotransferase family protein [Amycolatopsis acidicola]
MASSRAFTSEQTQRVLDQACSQVGLDASDATLLRFGENAIYKLTGIPIVARVGRSVPAAQKEVDVARWLAARDFPATRLAPGISPELVVHDFPVTFWEYISSGDTPITAGDFGRILRRLHALPAPSSFDLPKFKPMPKIPERLESLSPELLPASDIEFLRERHEEVESQFKQVEFKLPQGPIHGDAHPGNLIRTTSGEITLIDLEDFAYGPREWDAAVLSVRHQAFGWVSETEYQSYVDAYGFDPITWPGFPVVRAARELNMTTWLAQTMGESTEVAAEVRKRVADLRDKQAPRHWRVF